MDVRARLEKGRSGCARCGGGGADARALFDLLSEFALARGAEERLLSALERETQRMDVCGAGAVPSDAMNVLFHYHALFPRAICVAANVAAVAPKYAVQWIGCFGGGRAFVGRMVELCRRTEFVAPVLRFVESALCIFETQETVLELVRGIVGIARGCFGVCEYAQLLDTLTHVSGYRVRGLFGVVVDNAEVLFGDVVFNEVLFFRFVYFYYRFAENYDFDPKVVLSNRNLKRLFQYSIIGNHQESIRYMCNLLFNCCLGSADALEYVFEIDIVSLFIDSKEKLSFVVWNEFVELVCLMINDGTEMMIGNLLEQNIVNELVDMVKCSDEIESLLVAFKRIQNYIQMHPNELNDVYVQQIMNFENIN